MAKVSTYLHALNVGVHDKTALARVDLARMRLAAEIQTNIIPQAVGPASFRPGLEYLTSTEGNAESRIKEFVFGAADASLMEFSDLSMRVLVNDQVITRAAVSSTIINGDFSSATGWNTTGIGGGSATISGNKLTLNADTIEGVAQCQRSATTASIGSEHALRIIVERGPVVFRCGSTSGGDEYIAETVLPTGEHSLAFTPTAGTYYVLFFSKARVDRIVTSIQIEGAGVMELPTPWATADFPYIRLTQSADVCFVACRGRWQRRIERRSTRSWSVAMYQSDDGPFSANGGARVRMKTSALEGNTTLRASAAYFTAGHVGSLFRLDHTGQNVIQNLAQEDVYTDTIRVTGVNNGGASNDRDFVVTISGTWTGTLTLQRSVDGADAGFRDVPGKTWTANVTNETYFDDDDNSIYWYRIGFKPGEFTSGKATITLDYDGGGGFGICRVISVSSATQASVEVLVPMKNTIYTRDWRPGEWSPEGYLPSAVTLSDGRLWWFGEDRFWGSVSDDYASFDEEIDGDSGPIARSIATGGVNSSQWAMALDRLLVGTEGAVSTVRSSSLDEPLTPTNLGVKDTATTGAAPIDPLKVDQRGIFVERAGKALMELSPGGELNGYKVSQISKLTTDIFGSGVRASAVQRRPDTRIWLTLNDGSAVCMVYEAEDEVLAFIPLETEGAFESVAVLPALQQDRVYFTIRRTVNGSTVRYIEKMALDTDARPVDQCKVVDAFKVVTNEPASATLAGLTHLVGEEVVVWADGAAIEESAGVPAVFTVAGAGTITLPSAVSGAVVGLPYRGQYKSARLAYGATDGTAMLQRKVVNSVGMILTDFHRHGLKYGHSFTDPYRGLYPLPEMVDGKTADTIVLGEVHDEEPVVFPGEWSTDSRVCMEIQSPYPATICSLVFEVTTN